MDLTLWLHSSHRIVAPKALKYYRMAQRQMALASMDPEAEQLEQGLEIARFNCHNRVTEP